MSSGFKQYTGLTKSERNSFFLKTDASTIIQKGFFGTSSGSSVTSVASPFTLSLSVSATTDITQITSSASPTNFTVTGYNAISSPAVISIAAATSLSINPLATTNIKSVFSNASLTTFTLSPIAATSTKIIYSVANPTTYSITSSNTTDTISLYSNAPNTTFTITAVNAISSSSASIISNAASTGYTITVVNTSDTASLRSPANPISISLTEFATVDTLSLYSSSATASSGLSFSNTTSVISTSAPSTSYTLSFYDATSSTLKEIISNAEPAILYVYGYADLIEGYMWNYEIAPGVTAKEALLNMLDLAGYPRKIIKNKREVTSSGKLVVYDDDNITPILEKVLKDKDGLPISPLTSGIMAIEEKSSV